MMRCSQPDAGSLIRDSNAPITVEIITPIVCALSAVGLRGGDDIGFDMHVGWKKTGRRERTGSLVVLVLWIALFRPRPTHGLSYKLVARPNRWPKSMLASVSLHFMPVTTPPLSTIPGFP